MAIKRPDIYEHNNVDYAIADSDFVRGGFRTEVADATALYALSPKVDQLKERSTIVYVTGEDKYYILVDIGKVGNSAGWEEFVAGGTGTITGATNGLSVSGMDIVLGGELTGETTICTNDNNLTIYNNLEPNNACIQLTKSGASMGSSINYISVCECPNNQNAAISVGDFITHSTISVHPDYINIRSEEDTSGCSTNMRVCWSGMTISSDVNNFAGVEYAADYSSNYSSLSLITYNDLIAATSGITGTLTGATNGLSVSGMDVVLGGTLLSGTTISLNGNNLAFTGATGSLSTYVGTPTSYGSFYAGKSISGMTCGGDITLCSICAFGLGGGRITIGASSGASYVADYSLCNINNPRWIPDKQYVDDADSIVNVRCFSDTCTTTVNDYYIGVVSPFSSVGGDFVCLIASPGVGQKIIVTDMCGNALTDPIIIDAGGNFINGTTYTQSVINTNYGSITFIYNGAFWSATAFVN